MLPVISGKSGYMLYSGSAVPILGWEFSRSRFLAPYRTSGSGGYPVGTTGTDDETIVVRGIDSNPPFRSVARETNYIDFHLGVIGWLIPIHASLLTFQIDFLYGLGQTPPFAWTATFLGTRGNKQVLPDPFLTWPDAPPRCIPTQCDKPILAAYVFGSGEDVIEHVRQVSILETITRATYKTSNSLGHPVGTRGVDDVKANLVVDGGLDYWNNLAAPKRFRFYYGTTGSYYETPHMKVERISDVVANRQTGEIVSASIGLTAAEGYL